MKSSYLSIYFEELRSIKPFYNDLDLRKDIAKRLNAIEGLLIPLDSANKGRPSIQLAVLADAIRGGAVLEVFDSMIRDLREAANITENIVETA